MFKKSVYITALSLGVSVVSFINQLLVAYYFGANAQMDVFFSVTSSPLLIGGVLNISLSYFLIPYIKRHKLALSNLAYRQYVQSFFSNFIQKNALVFIFCFIPVFAYVFFFVNVGINVFNILLAITALATAFMLVILSFLTALYNVDERYSDAVAVSLLPPLSSMLVLWASHKMLLTLSVQLGLLVGSFLAVVLLVSRYKYRLLVFSSKKNRNSNPSSVSNFYKQMPYVIVGMLSFTVYQSIDAFWGTRIGTSNVSYLAYLQRLIIAVGVVVVSGPSAVLVPKLTEHYLKENKTDFVNLSIKALRWVFIIAAFFALVCSLLASEIIATLFQRAAFTEKDTKAMSGVFGYMLVGMCFMLSFTILFRIFFVQTNIKKSVFIGIFSTVVYFLLSGIFAHFLGLAGICIAYATTWFSVFIIAAYFTFKQFKNSFFTAQQFFFYSKLLFLCLFVALLFKCCNFSIPKGFTNVVVALCWKSAVIAVTYFFVGFYLFKIKEMRAILERVKIIKS